MKVKAEEIDINEEYEKLVPPSERKSLFDESEDYEGLREYIMAQPVIVLHNPPLPFRDVELTDYIAYGYNEVVEENGAIIFEQNGGKKVYAGNKKWLECNLIPVTKKESAEDTIHLFYLKERGAVSECDATGYYDEKTQSFVLMEGSIWASEVAKDYRFTDSEFSRKSLIKRNCKVISGYIIQSKDIRCDSPSAAASFVLGRTVNGWEVWTDKEGVSLKNFRKDNNNDNTAKQ